MRSTVMADGRAPSELQPPADIRLGVVVVNYQSSALLAANLERIDRGAIPSSTTVVVDNFSTAAERDAVRRLAHRREWLLEEPDSNLGFGAGVNRGVRRAAEAGCNAFLLLNPDVVISPTTISALVGAVPGHPHTALSPRLDMPDGSHGFDGARLDLRTGLTSYRAGQGDVGSDRWLTAACLLLTRCCWDLVGGFDEDYFLYWEDVDLTQRLLRPAESFRCSMTSSPCTPSAARKVRTASRPRAAGTCAGTGCCSRAATSDLELACAGCGLRLATPGGSP